MRNWQNHPRTHTRLGFRPRPEMQSTDLRVEFKDGGGAELRWCVFTKNSRGSVAKIICHLDRQARAPTAHVVSVFVQPQFRGRGLGEELVGLAKTFLRANGFQYLTLSAEENTAYKFGRLVELYRRCGFEIHPPGLTEFPIEYNGDEVFRKVPMRCSLASETTTTAAAPSLRLYDNVDFCVQMRQECLTRLRHGVGVVSALEWVEAHYTSSRRFAFALARRIRSKGHPDWMELAGYLIHLGKVQFKHKEWHAPFALLVRPPSSTSASSGESGDEKEEALVAKSGALPEDGEQVDGACRVLDTERYVGQGLDEATLSWSSWEYLFTVLTHQPAHGSSSAPIELAQVLRYFRLTDWLVAGELDHLHAGGDEELKQMALAFRECVLETVPDLPPSSDADLSRRQELISKYLGEDVYV